MSFTYPTDQTRLWGILGIKKRTELLQNKQSTLYRLMQELEAFDLTNNTAIVLSVTDKMDAIEAIDEKINTFLSSDNPRQVKSSSSYLEGEDVYEGKSEISIYKQQKGELVQQIQDLIDPCGCFVIQYGYASVIAT
jgi:hypothetical protein